ncbi:hypothetical protein ACF9IK_20045 [Kitasatospora hibisci]|uniref:hypothetical protein n=1 Tax=Kitasatospora hibisci TaxID=3369522 RepID=UPI003754F0E4
MQYRVIFAEFLSGQVWGELPFSDIQFTRTLNAPGAATIKVPLAAGPLDFQVLQPWRVLVYIQRDEQVLWGGPLVSYGVDLGAEEVTLSCLGLWAYYRRRVINYTSTHAQRDQALIVRTLLRDFGDGTGAYPWNTGPKALTLDDSFTTGILRDRTYWRHEWKNLGQAVEDMAAVANGFDFRIDPAWSAGRLINRFVMTYPTTGEPTSVVLEHGATCDVTAFTVDGSNIATEATATGAGDAEAQLVTWWYDLEHESDASRRIPRLATVQSRTDVTDTNTLSGYAQQAISEGSTALVVPAVRLYPDQYPTTGDLAVGQLVQVRASVAGWAAVNDTYKITEITTRVDSSGEDTALTLAPKGVFDRVGSYARP